MFRISPSLLDSFDYYMSIEDEEKSAIARKELIDYLSGVRTTNDAMKAGLDFEDAVVQTIQGGCVIIPNDEAYARCVAECANEVRGSLYQYHVQAELGGVIVHGFIDFLNRNKVTDLKTTAKYEIGKYTNKSQHRIYLYCLKDCGINKFTYLVSDFRNVYKEDYCWQVSYEDELKSAINDFMAYLNLDPEMKAAFEAKDHETLPDKGVVLL
jgi:hypothetical protein